MFSTEEEVCYVLVNDEMQYSLWPATIAIPAGWKPMHGPCARKVCREYVEEHWTDMRPKGLADRMKLNSAH